MKNLFYLVLVFGVLFSVAGYVLASGGGFPIGEGARQADKPKVQEAPAPAQTRPALKPEPAAPVAAVADVDPQRARELQKRRELITRQRGLLNNTEWDITLTAMSGEQDAVREDMLVFSEGKVFTNVLRDDGFEPTNFTLNIEEDGRLVWETMQSKEAKVVFIRGEITQDFERMSGIFSFQEPGLNRDFSFRSIARRKIY